MLKSQIIQLESGGYQGLGSGGNREILGKEYKLSVIK
jgi:hypothetical protein